MKLEQQCCSLELAKRLKELGVKQESFFYYYYSTILKSWLISVHKDIERDLDDISAFTVAELGNMFPFACVISTYNGGISGYVCESIAIPYHNKIPEINGETEADARAKMLIYLLENNLITLWKK